jgi:signal transduction histidine kinase
VGARPGVAAVLWLTFALSVVTCGVATVVLASPAGGTETYRVTMPAVGLVGLGSGLVALWRRPSSRFGILAAVFGAAFTASAFARSELLPLGVLGTVLAAASTPVAIHLAVSFPSGRLTTRAVRWVVGAAYVNWVLVEAPAVYLFDPAGSPQGILAVSDQPVLVTWFGWGQTGAAMSISVATTIIMIRRAVRAWAAHREEPEQRELFWMYLYGAILMPAVTVLMMLSVVGVLDFATSMRLVQIVYLVTPLFFMLALGRGAFGRSSEVSELGAWLAAGPTQGVTLAQMLARVFADPSLRLAYWLSPTSLRDRGLFVDAAGAALRPGAGEGRGRTEVSVDGRLVGAIDYDATAVRDPSLVVAAAAVITIVMDRERLAADLRASEAALRDSMARMVDATDTERAHLAANLHDRMQTRFAALSAAATQVVDQAQTAPERAAQDALVLRADIDTVATQLRRLVHSIMPPGLIERGLVAATSDLVDRLPLPVDVEVSGLSDGMLPPAVENTAYLVISETMTHAAGPAAAERAEVALEYGNRVLHLRIGFDATGEPGLGAAGNRIADRIDTLGGSLRIGARAGVGTMLEVSLPCGQ